MIRLVAVFLRKAACPGGRAVSAGERQRDDFITLLQTRGRDARLNPTVQSLSG
jgi:hypothetical protein